MASKPRKHSESGFYHAFQRGVNLFDIFEDDEDRNYYLEKLVKYAVELNVEIHAWCLMSNHTHLLLRASYDALSALMRLLGSTYARHFNMRHERSGPLFEGRFKSVCVETEAQYMAVLRYIHRNPIRHEESTLCGTYPWSSFGEYVDAAPKTCSHDFAFSLFGSLEAFIGFHDDWNDDERHLDVGTYGPLRDDEARRRADKALSEAGLGVTASSIGSLPRKLRNEAIACLKAAVGCSLRQIQRLTAIAYSAIRNAVKQEDGPCEACSPGPSPAKELAEGFLAPSPGFRASGPAVPLPAFVSASSAPSS